MQFLFGGGTANFPSLPNINTPHLEWNKLKITHPTTLVSVQVIALKIVLKTLSEKTIMTGDSRQVSETAILGSIRLIKETREAAIYVIQFQRFWDLTNVRDMGLLLNSDKNY